MLARRDPSNEDKGNEMDKMAHSIEITITGNYPHGQKQHAKVAIAGDGGLDHMIESFKAALVAAGFSLETAASIGLDRSTNHHGDETDE